MHVLSDDQVRLLTEGLNSAIDSLDGVYEGKAAIKQLQTLRDSLPDFDHPKPDLLAACKDVLLGMAGNESNGLTVRSFARGADVARMREAVKAYDGDGS
jgi:hypothetical protein